MEKVKIQAKTNGPYLVEGEVELLDGSGKAIKVEKKTFALCRCGGSQNKPFCDGTHAKNGFQAP
jgi:CDGSH-type Zn-finger protein